MTLKLINPQNTLPISVTGNKCALKCKHCNAKYLHHMLNIKNLSKEKVEKYSSFLISGGCEKNGIIPFKKQHLEKLSHYPQRKNFHTGLIEDTSMAKDIADIADAISIDIVFDNKTIEYVYNMNKDKYSYKKTLELFLKYSDNVFPHITIGLNGGRLSHEFDSINMLREYTLKAVVFLVLIPTKGTFFENSSFTNLQDIEKVLQYARKTLNTNIILGCMKPHGNYGKKIDFIAKKYVDAIVKPFHELGKITDNECCVLSYL